MELGRGGKNSEGQATKSVSAGAKGIVGKIEIAESAMRMSLAGFVIVDNFINCSASPWKSRKLE